MGRVRAFGAVVVLAAMTVSCRAEVYGVADRTDGNASRTGTVPVPSVSLPGDLELDEGSWQELWRSTPGTGERRCVAVGDRTWVRSGEFVVGNFAAYRARWDGSEENSKLAYTPLDSAGYPSLLVTARTLASRERTAIEPVATVFQAWSLDGVPFYSTGTVLPHRGPWRLLVRAGSNWGCFDVTI
jgi:hypothetical protein